MVSPSWCFFQNTDRKWLKVNQLKTELIFSFKIYLLINCFLLRTLQFKVLPYPKSYGNKIVCNQFHERLNFFSFRCDKKPNLTRSKSLPAQLPHPAGREINPRKSQSNKWPWYAFKIQNINVNELLLTVKYWAKFCISCITSPVKKKKSIIERITS